MLLLTYTMCNQTDPIVTVACGSAKEAFHLYGVLVSLDNTMYVTVSDASGTVIRDYTKPVEESA